MMMLRIFCATAVVLVASAGLSAQTVRFDTNVGTFDMELNPTGNPFLQGHVDNMIAYVQAGRYDLTVINRVNEVSTGGEPDFVLQMGGFQAPFLTLPNHFNQFPAVGAFDPVIVDEDNDGAIDFDTTGLTNSRATVSMALSSAGPNSATSSFFINLNDIPSLDPGGDIGEFVPFAIIKNMETINLIDALPTVSIPGGGIGSSHIPILEDNKLVIVERAFLVNATDEMIDSALANADIDGSSPGVIGEPPLNDPGGLLTPPTIPEPSSLLLATMMAMLSALKRPR